MAVPGNVLAVLGLAVSQLMAADLAPAPVRQGAYWIRTSTEIFASPASGRVLLNTRGAVIVRGGSGTQIGFVLRAKTLARTEAEAVRVLRAVSIQSDTRGKNLVLTLQLPVRSDVQTELEIHAPSKLTQMQVFTQEGNVEVYDIDGLVQAQSGGGVIQMDRIGGDAMARTGGGEIRLGKIGGGVR